MVFMKRGGFVKEKIGIITDSTCDIPEELLKKLGVKVLPLRILYKDSEFRDGIDITANEVYNRLPDEVPQTSLPSPEEVLTLFEDMKEQGYTHAIVIHLSSGLSGTGQMIQTVAEQVDDLIIRVFDSKSISMGLGFIVIEAAKAIRENVSFETVCNSIKNTRERLSVYFVLGTLEYLRKGGRIGKVSGTIGELLDIKPIIAVNDEGIYTTFAKARGKVRSLEKMIEIAKNHLSNAVSQVAVCYGGAQEEAAYLFKQLKDMPNVKDIFTSTVSPVIGVHTGPGTIGFAILQD